MLNGVKIYVIILSLKWKRKIGSGNEIGIEMMRKESK
jgi:hypothetical protein